MTTFHFETMPSGPLFFLESSDIIVFTAGSANAASVVYNPTSAEGDTITIGLGDHSVRFDAGVIGVAANQNLQFADGSHLLIGGPRSEIYEGAAGNDALFGGGGADTLAGHAGDNLLQGNQGDDVLTAEGGADTIYGGQGSDLIVTGLGSAGDKGDFAQGNKGDDTIQGGAEADVLLGGQGDDSIQGRGGVDFLNGNLGNDFIQGGAGSRMLGEDGADTLQAQGPNCLLTGGAGADLFSFTFSGHDDVRAAAATITDWASEDSLSVAGLRAASGYQEATAADFSSALALANGLMHSGSEVVVVQIGADVVAFIQTGGGPDADLAIGLLGRGLADIGASNFI